MLHCDAARCILREERPWIGDCKKLCVMSFSQSQLDVDLRPTGGRVSHFAGNRGIRDEATS